MSFPIDYQRTFNWTGGAANERLVTAFINIVATELTRLGAANVAVKDSRIRFASSPLAWILKTRLLAGVDYGSIEIWPSPEGVRVRVFVSLKLMLFMHVIPALGATGFTILGITSLPWIVSLAVPVFFALILAANYFFSVMGYPRFIRDAFARAVIEAGASV